MGELIEKVGEYCGAVLMHKKPAAMFTASLEPQNIMRALAELELDGLEVRVLNYRKERSLVFVFIPCMLQAALQHTMVKNTLHAIGYPVDGSLDEMLEHLAKRIRGQDKFPHEVGFFLGYPPHDVLGFIRNKGAGCQLCGMWKVYGDVEKAKQLFHEYEECKQYVTEHIKNGGSFKDLCTYRAVAT